MAGKPKPWTKDPVLQSVYFTNPYRENDKTTVWFRENVRDPLREDPAVLFATICFRWFNWIPTGEVLQAEGLLTDWETRKAVTRLGELRAEGRQVFTGAFNISNSGSPKQKVERVCEDYVAPAWKHCRIHMWNRKATLADTHEWLSALPGLGGGGFMAAQVVADLKYTCLLADAPDWWTWCSPGPGSKKGLNLVLGRPPESPYAKGEFLWEINALRERVNDGLKIPPLHAQDVQNCCCEFFKYERSRNEGRAKRGYSGVC